METVTARDQQTTFTAEQLAQFDGRDGHPAYVAVDGVVYDVSAIKPWAGGVHHGGAHAGADMSQVITRSPHGKRVLEMLPQVGTLV